MSDEATRAEALEILRSLVERVIIHPIDGGFEIELVGEIARMVALGLADSDSKKAAFSQNAARSVKVVAGIGFEPMTFRL